MLLVENEQLHRMCTHVLELERPAFGDLNRVLGLDLASFALPLAAHQLAGDNGGGGGGGGDDAATAHRWALSDTLAHLCAHPGFPLLTAKLTPQMAPRAVAFASDSWEVRSVRAWTGASRVSSLSRASFHETFLRVRPLYPRFGRGCLA